MIDEFYELNNPVTNALSLRVSRFVDGARFKTLNSFNGFTVILVVKGRGALSVDASRYSFDGRSLMSFSLYQPFQIAFEGDCEGYSVEFHPDFFCLHKHRSDVSCNGVLFNNIYESPLISLTGVDESALNSVFAGMLAEMRREDADTEVLLSYLKILLIDGTRVKVSQRNEGGLLDMKIPGKLLNLQAAIEGNFRTIHNAAGYADLLSVTQNALNRACKDYFNKTLTELITDRVVLEAKRELYLTLKPVKSIAYDLGFGDEFHFSKYFKRNVGVSPQVFRDTVGTGKAVAD